MPEVNLHFLYAAQLDLNEAALWYESQVVGLGSRFLSSIEETLQMIVEHPELFSMRFKKLRRAPVHSFPYGVWYILSGNTILIIAIFHGSRNQKLLKRRI